MVIKKLFFQTKERDSKLNKHQFSNSQVTTLINVLNNKETLITSWYSGKNDLQHILRGETLNYKMVAQDEF